MRCFFSLSSTSVAAPTLTTTTPPDELGETLLELLTVAVGVGVLDLTLDLLDAGLDVALGAVAIDDGGVVLGDDDRRARPSMSTVTFSSLRPTSSVITVPPVRMAMS